MPVCQPCHHPVPNPIILKRHSICHVVSLQSTFPSSLDPPFLLGGYSALAKKDSICLIKYVSHPPLHSPFYSSLPTFCHLMQIIAYSVEYVEMSAVDLFIQAKQNVQLQPQRTQKLANNLIKLLYNNFSMEIGQCGRCPLPCGLFIVDTKFSFIHYLWIDCFLGWLRGSIDDNDTWRIELILLTCHFTCSHPVSSVFISLSLLKRQFKFPYCHRYHVQKFFFIIVHHNMGRWLLAIHPPSNHCYIIKRRWRCWIQENGIT